MGDHRMAGIGLVLDQHFPVAVVHVAQHAARHFQFPDGRAVDHVVEARQRLAEKLLEARSDVVELAEDEAAIVVHVAHRGHAARRQAVGKAGIVISRLQGNAGKAAIEAEGPGVIRAAKKAPDIATALAGQPRPFVRAAIVQDLDAILGVTNHDDGLRADRRGVIVADLRHLALVADIDPGIGEEMFHLELEQLLVEIEIAMDLGLAHERGDGLPVAAILADHAPFPFTGSSPRS